MYFQRNPETALQIFFSIPYRGLPMASSLLIPISKYVFKKSIRIYIRQWMYLSIYLTNSFIEFFIFDMGAFC
jgi:hypothetical protein